MDSVSFHHPVYRPNLLYLIYRRLRPVFGIPLGFILMYGAYTGNLTPVLLLAGFGFLLMHLFGDFYNDYWDYDEDIRNDRVDKFTTLGLLNRHQMRSLSFLIAPIALIALLFTNVWVSLIGIYYLIVLTAYSHPGIHLKGHVGGYSTLSSVYLFLPMTLNSLTLTELSISGIIFALFFFFQFVYILCQKDSTDTKDSTNLFIDKGWRKSSAITLIFATLSSIFLLGISITSIGLLSVWGINAYSKILNAGKIWKREITRELRSKLILIEFLTPYLYVGVMTVGL